MKREPLHYYVVVAGKLRGLVTPSSFDLPEVPPSRGGMEDKNSNGIHFTFSARKWHFSFCEIAIFSAVTILIGIFSARTMLIRTSDWCRIFWFFFSGFFLAFYEGGPAGPVVMSLILMGI